MSIRLRFVHCGGAFMSRMILARTGGLYSHVECVTPEGLYLGAHWQDGVQARPADYDRGEWTRQNIVTVPTATELQAAEFYAFQRRHIGEAYDFKAIGGFLAPWWENGHQGAHAICSAFQALALRTSSIFPYPLNRPAHEVTPRDLLLGLSFTLDVGPGETPDDVAARASSPSH